MSQPALGSCRCWGCCWWLFPVSSLLLYVLSLLHIHTWGPLVSGRTLGACVVTKGQARCECPSQRSLNSRLALSNPSTTMREREWYICDNCDEIRAWCIPKISVHNGLLKLRETVKVALSTRVEAQLVYLKLSNSWIQAQSKFQPSSVSAQSQLSLSSVSAQSQLSLSSVSVSAQSQLISSQFNFSNIILFS